MGFPGRAETPIFSRKLNNRECKEGRPIKFECAAKGIPQPEVTWYVNHDYINQSESTYGSQNHILNGIFL
jgi:hypothetical protein